MLSGLFVFFFFVLLPDTPAAGIECVFAKFIVLEIPTVTNIFMFFFVHFAPLSFPLFLFCRS